MTDIVTVTNPVTNEITVTEQANVTVVSVITEGPAGPQGSPYASAQAQAATETARDEAVAAKIAAEAARTDILNRISFGYGDPPVGINGDIYFKIV